MSLRSAGQRATSAKRTGAEPIRVALLISMDIGYGRGVVQGIRHAITDGLDGQGQTLNWRIHLGPPNTDVLPTVRRWKPDGIIAHVMDEDLAKRLRRMSCPVVNTTSTVASWTGPLVEVDHERIGEMAAEYFVERGYRSFGYLGSDWAGFSLARENAFRAALSKTGHLLSSCHLNYLPQPPVDLPWGHIDRSLVSWLGDLPKPAAVLASNDRPARELADACRATGLRVPDDVAILGVDNDEFECFVSQPPLSSIVNPSETIGRRACEMLQRLMNGGRGSDGQAIPEMVPPRWIITRASTDGYAVDDPALRAALLHIREQAIHGLTAQMVHERSTCSRRMLERLFRNHLGRSVGEEIKRGRVRSAAALLSETDLSIESVATQSGFSSARLLGKAFQSVYKLSPSGYRGESRAR